MKKLKLYDNQPIKDSISIKIDGIQAMLNDKGEVISRSNKKLYNISPYLLSKNKKYEIFHTNFNITSSILRSHSSDIKIGLEHIYEIWPGTDSRLILDHNEDIQSLFNYVLSLGYEGLVIDKKYKLKKIETIDVPILDVVPGQGQHLGRMGALVTPKGRVGTGFSFKQREEPWKDRIGMFIEVECMEFTADGKFRHARYKRLRWDKDQYSEG